MADNNIWTMLRKRYPKGEYALLSEVSNAAGFNRSRSCDYISIGLWPSRGLEIIGIEVKSHRGDWLRELKMPQKAEAFYKYCDRWFLLIEDEGVAKMEEIPPTWGLLCVKGSRIYCKKEAPILTPEQVTKNFMAALFKRATEGNIHPSEIAGEIEKAKQVAIDIEQSERRRLQGNYDALKRFVDDFQKASGVEIHKRWGLAGGATEIGNAVKFVTENKGADFKKYLEQKKTEAHNLIQKIEELYPPESESTS